MKTKICVSCGREFPETCIINGKKRRFQSRIKCFQCSPFDINKSQKIIRSFSNIYENLTDIQKQILNGHLLGDGNISKPLKGNSMLKISRSLKDIEYLKWTSEHFHNFNLNKKIYYRYIPTFIQNK